MGEQKTERIRANKTSTYLFFFPHLSLPSHQCPNKKALRLVVTAPTSYRSAHACVNYFVALEGSRLGTLQPNTSLFSSQPAFTTLLGFGDFDDREMRTGGPLIALAMEKTVKRLWWDRILRNGIPGRYVTKKLKYIQDFFLDNRLK